METVFNHFGDVYDYIRKKYPKCKAVPVCAFNIIHNFYEDDTYSKQIAQTTYHEQDGTEYKHKLEFSAL